MYIKQTPIADCEYIREACPKTQIYLHHTVSAKNNGINVSSTFTIDKGKSKIAVPFVVDANGTIYQLFDPKYWAYHLGVPDVNNVPLCKKSIAIELVNEGPIQIKGNKKYWFDGKYEYKGETTKVDWRGYEEFASYTDAQIQATAELVKNLCDLFKIPKTVLQSYDYSIDNLKYNGILSHCNVRRDKTDISPAFNLKNFSLLIA